MGVLHNGCRLGKLLYYRKWIVGEKARGVKVDLTCNP